MVEILSKWIVLLFGLFFIATGFLMLFAPQKAREILKKAGSTNLINYTEITVRMIPAMGLIGYADYSRFPQVFSVVGWFILGTSVVLYFVPRKWHHSYSLKSAEILKPIYFQIISPFSMSIGLLIIYAVF
ncbi:hypothetical protein [Aquiflexum gelatinilyticum]|uniref:Uncharacterized protein n=1 Tax=Aquiflexum gelatinilyticum TaxID=2961943 RepID=A0A9X2P1C9_9BACT|nr:hypothetical protein [Aquiflexum gelatinilyticum]MCR9013689.1 hypothetical protein [Aquiflexum gelatinilyticum]